MIDTTKKDIIPLDACMQQLKEKDLEISKLNEMLTIECKKVYDAVESCKEECRKTMVELDKEPKSAITKLVMQPIKNLFMERARAVTKKRTKKGLVNEN